MDIKDRKKEIIVAVESTNDKELIEEIFELIHPEEGTENVEIDSLPLELQAKITKALDDYKAGNYIMHEQMKQKGNLQINGHNNL